MSSGVSKERLHPNHPGLYLAASLEPWPPVSAALSFWSTSLLTHEPLFHCSPQLQERGEGDSSVSLPHRLRTRV